MKKKKKKIGDITLKDLEAMLQKGKNLNVDQDEYIENLNKILSIARLSEILNSTPKLFVLNETNDLIKKWTGKDRDNLESLSVKDIELIIKKAIKSKQYDMVANFVRLYHQIMRYLRD